MRLLHAQFVALGLLLSSWTACVSAAEPSAILQLNAENPHYFLWRGKPTILITSGEHYGSVLNLDFDYSIYLATLAKYGFNLTRTFCGASYVEPVGSFNIAENTLAPKPGRYLTPWERSDQPGAWDGGNKWDLTKWNEDYFKRFKDFVSRAATHGVVVEVNLFCPFYENGRNTLIKVRKETPAGTVEEDRRIKESSMWPLSPFNPANHVNGFNPVSSHEVYTLDQNGGLLAVQESFVRRIVEELKDFDNIYYEICNEPYFAGVTLEWQKHIADVIEAAQKNHPAKKLISQNIANHSAKITDPFPSVSIFNFHYTYPPIAVAANYALNKVIGENETGFRGTSDEVYRNEAWDFLLAGGGLFNNLDYSFTALHEGGTFHYPSTQPGGGGPSFHQQLAVLVKFMNALDFIHLKPADELVHGLASDASFHLLANPGKEYAAYLHHSATPMWKDSKKLNAGNFQDIFKLEAPGTTYELTWLDPETGHTLAKETVHHQGGGLKITSPEYARDLALHLKAVP